MAIAINPVDKSLIVVIELVLLALDGEAEPIERVSQKTALARSALVGWVHRSSDLHHQ
jgi:hypothetical protein